ncbi:MAG TPA: haloalkane dehalogenase [Myxococcota bacterium]|nr:haloalkane dehalogenase [Myxococcota bacterium]
MSTFEHPKFGAVARTPDERFAGLPGWKYAPRYLDDLRGFEGLRMHYVDEGPRDARAVFLCLHGEPSWAYLYRKMLPVFTAAGHRVVAPDWFGFGRSDKPVRDESYTFAFHRRSLVALFERLALSNVCLVVQDWGGLLGLTLPKDEPAVTRLLVMNTAIGVGEPLSPGFAAWKEFVASQPDFAVGALMKRATSVLTDAEAAAYDAPFPDATYKAGVRRFPQLVPIAPAMEGVADGRSARAFLRERWTGRSFMAIGAADPVLGPPVMNALRAEIRNCPEPLVVPEAGHFVQEWGEPIARAALGKLGL